MIEGIGIDVVEILRLQHTVEVWGDQFLRRIYTDRELGYARSKKDPMPHLAARFAGTEAVSTARATGWKSGLRWKDVEVENDESGKPTVILHGGAKNRLKEGKILVSISHSDNVVVACAILEE